MYLAVGEREVPRTTSAASRQRMLRIRVDWRDESTLATLSRTPAEHVVGLLPFDHAAVFFERTPLAYRVPCATSVSSGMISSNWLHSICTIRFIDAVSAFSTMAATVFITFTIRARSMTGGEEGIGIDEQFGDGHLENFLPLIQHAEWQIGGFFFLTAHQRNIDI